MQTLLRTPFSERPTRTNTIWASKVSACVAAMLSFQTSAMTRARLFTSLASIVRDRPMRTMHDMWQARRAQASRESGWRTFLFSSRRSRRRRAFLSSLAVATGAASRRRRRLRSSNNSSMGPGLRESIQT